MIKSKYLSLFPYMLLAVIASNIVNAIGQTDKLEIWDRALTSATDLFALQMAGFSGFIASGVSWYLSSLYLVSFIIYPFLCKRSKTFSQVCLPIVAILMYGYLCKMGGLNYPGKWLGIAYHGLLRGIAGISLGCISWEISLYLDKSDEKSHIVYGAIELAGYFVTILYIIFHASSDHHDYLIVSAQRHPV